MSDQSSVPSSSFDERSLEFLEKFANLLDEYDVSIDYTNRDDGLHFKRGGDNGVEIWKGWLSRFNNESLGEQTKDLRGDIEKLKVKLKSV